MWLLRFIFFVNHAQPPFLTQLDYSPGELIVLDTGTELAIESVDGHLAEGEAVDILDRSS
jgi:hypothetical protein